MSRRHQPIDLKRVRVYPLASRNSMQRVEDILVSPDAPPPTTDERLKRTAAECAHKIHAARAKDAAVILMYGAHLVKNGASLLVDRMMERDWLTHLATNGAGSIHDWEFAFQGWSTESVEQNVATGTFGTWDETGRYLHLALLAGALRNEGYGAALGRFIQEDGVTLPPPVELEEFIREEPAHPLGPARVELLRAMREYNLPTGPIQVPHPWKHTSIFAQAFRRGVPLSVHPGIGYDIISNHPWFNGAVLGRAAGIDFALIGGAIERLDGGVVLSVGSAIMAPQVFEKSISCVNNLRLQSGRSIVRDHTFYVVDLQDSGNWDWTKGEPPKDNPAYYLRFCKSFSRMGGTMHYVQCDNVLFLHTLVHALSRA